MNQNVGEFLLFVKNSVDEYLDNFITERVDNCRLNDSIRYSLFADGKKIRSAFLIASFKLFNSNLELTIPAASAIECIHTYSLIHDDLPSMDNDRIRRGKLCNHLVYGDAIATLSGDALLTMAFEILSNGTWDINERGKLEIIKTLACKAGASGMVCGQALEFSIPQNDIDEKNLLKIYKMKTSDLFSASCKIGGTIAGVDSDRIKILENFGEKIGFYFQLNDDFNDIGKDSEKESSSKSLTLINLTCEEYTKKMASNLFSDAINELDKLKGCDIRLLMGLAELISIS